MMKKFWLYRVKANDRKRYELKENIGGNPCKASLSRGVIDKANKVSILARSISKVSNMLSDAIEVIFGPPPSLIDGYALNKTEIKEVKKVLKDFEPVNNLALS